MICETELGQCKEFGENGHFKPIEHKSDKFHVIATMGSSMHTSIEIILLPTNEQSVPPPTTSSFASDDPRARPGWATHGYRGAYEFHEQTGPDTHICCQDPKLQWVS